MLQFTRLKARRNDTLALAAVPEKAEPFEPQTRMYRYEHADEGMGQWFHDDYDVDVADICVFDDPNLTDPALDDAGGYFVYLSSEGDVIHTYYRENFREKIEGAGTWTSRSKLGRLYAIEQVGSHLYACGDNGQFYRREGRDDWRPLSREAVVQVERERDALRNIPNVADPDFLRWSLNAQNPLNQATILFSIAGRDDVVAFGERGAVRVWDGKTVVTAEMPPEHHIVHATMGTSDEIWLVGRDGFVGRLHDGVLQTFEVGRGSDLFVRSVLFDEALFIASSARPGGIHMLDPATGRAVRVPVSRQERSNNSFVGIDRSDRRLWIATTKELLCRTQHGWTAIDHPDF